MEQVVICKHKNSRYYRCEVVEVSTASFYQVTFTDGSFSNDLVPEDIEVRPITMQRARMLAKQI